MQLLATDASLDGGDLPAFGKRAARAVASNPDWRNVVLIDPASYAIVASVLPLPVQRPTASSPAAVDEVVRTRQPMVAGVLVGQIVKAPVIQFRVPVTRGDKVTYVLTVVVDPGTLSGMFAAQQLAPSWTGAVLDKAMVLAGRSRDAQRFVGKRATPTLADRIAASSTGMFTALNQEGATVYTAFSRSALTGWTVAIGVPAEEVDGPIRRIVLQGVAAGSVLMALALLLATLVGRTILRTRKAHEVALDQFNDLVARIPVGIYRYRMTADGGHRFDFVSSLFCKQVGATQAQILQDPKAAFNCFHADDLQVLITTNDAARKTLQPFQWEGRVQQPEGMRWLRMESTPDLQPNGDIVWNGMQHDISLHVIAAEEMSALVRKQLAILNNELVGIVTVREGVIVWANLAYEQMLGYAEGELVGAPTRQTYPSEAAYQATSAAAYAAVSGGGVWRARVAQMHKDGREIWLDVSGKVLDLDTGQSLWTFVDVTSLQQSEAALKQKLDELERFNRAMVGRELKMVVLKQEVNELCRAAGLPERHVASDAKAHELLGKARP
jgi:PAS domain S-box-containing protein